MIDFFGEFIFDMIFFVLWLVGYLIAGILPFTYTRNLRKRSGLDVRLGYYSTYKHDLIAGVSRAQLAALGAITIVLMAIVSVGLIVSITLIVVS